MLLYEPTDNRKLNISYSLVDMANSTTRLQTGITDNFATMSLAKLIGGGIKSIDELNAAEQCLRALIFHETVVRQAPCVTVDNHFSSELELDKSPVQLTDYLGTNIIKHYTGNINNLRSFADEEKASREQQRRSDARAKDPANNIEWNFSVDFVNGPLEHVANNISDYTANCFANNLSLQSRYILPIAETKLSSYISYPFLLSNFESTPLNEEKPYQAKEFFGSIDEIWRVYNDRLRNRIDVAMPLFLSIVLNRSVNREDIGRVILELRDEYASARKELWSIFEQLDDLSITDQSYVQTLTDIEVCTKDILQSSLLPSSSSRLQLSLDNQKRFGSVLTAGASMFDGGVTAVISLVNAFLGSLSVGRSFNMTAARLTANHLGELKSQGLLSMLSERERYDLKQSLRRYS